MVLDLIGPGAAGHAFPPMLLLLLALVIDAGIGGSGARWLPIPHPVRLIGGAVGWFDRRLNREHRPPGDRAARGAITVLMVVTACWAIGWGVAWLTRNHDFGWMVELALVTALLAQRSLFVHVRAVATGLRRSGLAGGRAAVAHIVGRDVSQLDEHGVARAAIESCAENFSDGVVAPVFWYVLLGAPGILVYKAVNTMDSMIGHRTPRHQAFGMVAARLDDALNLIPARLAGLYLAIAAAVVPRADPAASLRTMLRDAGRHRSVNAGWPEAAAAGALGLALAGPRRYPGVVVDDAWIGAGRARATAEDIDRALKLFVAGCLVNGLTVGVIAIIVLRSA